MGCFRPKSVSQAIVERFVAVGGFDDSRMNASVGLRKREISGETQGDYGIDVSSGLRRQQKSVRTNKSDTTRMLYQDGKHRCCHDGLDQDKNDRR